MIRCPGCNEENPAKFRLCGYCGRPLDNAAATATALPVHEVRKTVTIVFADLKDSTALGEKLDAEALHEVKDRYFAAMAAEIARHGGTVEKYIGDAIMAVFGLPRAHEDDALRAVRAAAGMHRALDAVNAQLEPRFGVRLANRTGVNTGEVVARDDDPNQDQKLGTGDAVNLAARLEQAAPVDEILLGEATWQLVRDAVDVEPVGEIAVKGKALPVRAFRLLAVHGQDGVTRRHDLPLVGRDAELAALRALYAEVRTQRVVRLVTIIGDAGAGKTRLVHEVLAAIAPEAPALRGRCLPYGDGITFWPLSMMLRQAAAIGDDEPPEHALERLRAMVGDDAVTERLASVAGLSSAAFALHEINWAARSVLERMAAAGPVLAVIDDIQWAEPAFLDLIEHVLRQASDAPILLLVAARHDLLETRPDWSQGEGAMRIVLGPLTDAAAAQVLNHRLGEATLDAAVAARIVAAAGGNPLYAEQLLSMLVESGALRLEQGRWLRADARAELDVPPTIHALLEDRLDRLARSERATVEPAAVIGLEFEREALAALAPDALQPRLDDALGALERKQFIQTTRDAALEAIYRFHHHLVRETVYGGLLKRTRAQLHLRFVRWAEQAYAARALEMDEILGYHLEQAQRCLRELGPLDAEGLAAGAQGAERLARAARRVFARGDMHAAIGLYGRAVAMLAAEDPARLVLLPDLAETLLERGDFARAREILAEAEGRAARAGNVRIAASARLMRMRVRLFSAEPGDWNEQALRLAHESIPLFEREQAHPELARAWRLIGFLHGSAARYRLASDAVVRAMVHARAIEDQRLIGRNAMGLALSMVAGPTPVREAIQACDSMRADVSSDRQAEGSLLCALAQLHAMAGEFDSARACYRQGRQLMRELGEGINVASTGVDLLLVELLAGDLAGAEQEVKIDYDFLSQAGETYSLSTMAALLSRVVRDLGRDEQALEISLTAEQVSAEDDVESQARWRAARAPILARRGSLAQAEAMARQAVELSRQTDAPCLQGYCLSELAAVLGLADLSAQAASLRQEACALYAAKGDIVSAARLQLR